MKLGFRCMIWQAFSTTTIQQMVALVNEMFLFCVVCPNG